MNKSSNDGKTTLPLNAPSVEKNSGDSQVDIPYCPKSSPLCDSGFRDSISAEADGSVRKNRTSSSSCKTSSLKGVSPVGIVSIDANDNISKGKGNMNRGELQRKKRILSLVQSTEISKKERHKVNGIDRKKRSRSHKGRYAATVSNHSPKEASLLPDTSKSYRKHRSLDQKSSSFVTKDTRVLKSTEKQPEVISFVYFIHLEIYQQSYLSD